MTALAFGLGLGLVLIGVVAFVLDAAGLLGKSDWRK